jgi:uncharacterized SAM-binding protein YcdF (DUF218 family)
MSFALLKFFETVSEPSTVLLFLCVGGLFLALWRDRSPWGPRLLILGTGGFAACAILPVGLWLMLPLEDRFPPPRPLPARIDGIIVLGGAIAVEESAERGMPALNAHAARMTEFVALSRRYPRAQLLFSAGSADPFANKLTEADIARTFLAEMGVSSDRVIFEDRSRNTHENALYSRRLVQLRPGQSWLLVASAADMPRAVGCFRAVGWPVIAFPTDYRTTPGGGGIGLYLPNELRDLDWAVHEWIGLVYYRLRGWTSSFFPGP